jgi:cation diffusion facilitator CzcD-associated flavoprotein CzcO
MQPAPGNHAQRATVVVIGAGQAGLSAAYHLQRAGFQSALDAPESDHTYVVFDANLFPGGAWQHRWESLRMGTVNGIFDLPGFPKPPLDDSKPSRDAVPRYFADYERQFGFPIMRPVIALSVRRFSDDPGASLLIETDAGNWLADYVINATGTWTNPVLPKYPGEATFLGRQLHTRDYSDLSEFAGDRVAIVGGGISAVQQLEEISRVAKTVWYTRGEPVFIEGHFEPETTGRDVIARVTADVAAGRPHGSIVSYTGLGWTPYTRAARDRGVLDRRPMFQAIEPHGLREADGTFTSVDTILWATGFRPALSHLDPMMIRNASGGFLMHGTEVANDHRLHLIGFGPSQSTVGANRSGRAAVNQIIRDLPARRSLSA